MTALDFANSKEQVAGWYADPWGIYQWRWWDGAAWTSNVNVKKSDLPRIPNFISIPVIVSGILSFPFIIATLIFNPSAVVLSIVPMVVLFPGLWWLLRVAPLTKSSITHSVLWGAFVSTFISGLFNTVVAGFLGGDIAGIASAPIVEEFTKGLGVLWVLRRKDLNGVLDSIMHACWVALGFAVVEDMLYFSGATGTDLLQFAFVRGVLTSFAHPLFTFWIGLSVGLSVRWQQSTAVHFLWGFLLAVTAHAGWNGTITYYVAERGADGPQDFVVPYLFYLVLLVAVCLGLFFARRAQQRLLRQQMRVIAARYQISEQEVEIFANWRTMLATRKSLAGYQRFNFDRLYATLIKLALLHGGPTQVERADEELLAGQLQQARSTAFRTVQSV